MSGVGHDIWNKTTLEDTSQQWKPIIDETKEEHHRIYLKQKLSLDRLVLGKKPPNDSAVGHDIWNKTTLEDTSQQ